MKFGNSTLQKDAIRICVIYFILGVLWIAVSDNLTGYLFTNKNLVVLISTYKGFIYIVITTIILYYLLNRLLKKVDYAEIKLCNSYHQLADTNKALEEYVKQMKESDIQLRKQYNKILEYDKELNISEKKYKTLISQMQLGLALYEGKEGDDITNYVLTEVNESHERISGFINSEIIDKKFSLIHSSFEPENLAKLNNTITTGEPSHYERHKKENYYEIIAYRPKKNQLAVIINDITQRKKAEETLKVSEENFRNLFVYSSDAIFLFDHNEIIKCNSAAVELLGYESDQFIIGKSPLDFALEKLPDGQSTKDVISCVFEQTLRNGKFKFEWWYKKVDGSLIPTEVMMTTIFSDGKNLFHALCRDISERKQFEERLQFLSYHDQLTGLYNRRYFDQEMEKFDVQENLPYTVTMADINGLKLINDSFGHEIGDTYIKKIAEVLGKAYRPKDLIFRLAGDEFIILSPNTDEVEVEKILKKFKNLSKNESVCSMELSISFGFVTKKNIEESSLEIMKKAEDVMYRKKLLESPSMRGKAINTIITTLHEKNAREELHSRRVSQLCESMGYVLGMHEDEIRELKTVGLLHDIGKVAIEERILNKEGKLSEDEWEEIKKHPEIGYRILSTVNHMSEMAEYVLAHHERWNGMGYPKGLKGEAIPLVSRIIAIADAYDAMVSERSYRNALSKDYAIQELRNNAGTQFCPELVELFIGKVLRKAV